MTDSDVRNFEIASDEDELSESNRRVWKLLGIKQGDSALFFPAPNALVPIMFARFMNKRKVTFVDSNEICVSTLIKLAAQMRLSNVTVKLSGPAGKFPLPDASFEVSFSDWGLSYSSSPENSAKELVRVAKPGGRVGALEENGAPVMYPCPPDILAIRSKIDMPRADRLIMGRRVYGLFKANNLKKITMQGFSNFLPGEREDKMAPEIRRRILQLESSRDVITALGVSPQEIEKYSSWLKSQIGNASFLIQFNSILTIGEK